MTLFSLAASGLRTGEAQSLQCSGASSSQTTVCLTADFGLLRHFQRKKQNRDISLVTS